MGNALRGLAVALTRIHGNSSAPMSEFFFDTLVVSLPGRFKLFATLMRSLATAAIGWGTDRGLRFKRSFPARNEAEFPLARIVGKLLERTSRGPRAAGRAFIDALRLNNHSVNLEDQHEISYKRERATPFAWRSPPQERRSVAPALRACQGAGAEIVLAKSRCFLFA
ncbi:MAG: hypothetical protein ABI795_05315 [Chthoniobacterales bacterium]